MLKDFKEFALRGSVLDMAVGIILGAAFGKIVSSLVNDVLMPPIGLLLGKADFSNLYWNLSEGTFATLEEAKAAGAVTINYGVFINTILDFVLVALAVFLMVRQFNRFRRKKEAEPEPTTRECPFCCSTLSLKATRCAFCTSELEPA